MRLRMGVQAGRWYSEGLSWWTELMSVQCLSFFEGQQRTVAELIHLRRMCQVNANVMHQHGVGFD